MGVYPPYIYAALDCMTPADDDAAAYLAAFTAAWGSYEPPDLLRALREGIEFDRLFAIWALAATRTAQGHEALLPLLESAQPLERWASALALADEYHDERALPALGRMLSEMLPPCPDRRHLAVTDAIEYHACDYYFLWRREIPDLLGEWGQASSAPALRAGLLASVCVELALDDLAKRHDEQVDGILGGLNDWIDLEDSMVYALGRLGGFGALAGIEGAQTPLVRSPGAPNASPPQSHLDHWRIHLIMGSLHGQYSLEWPSVWRWPSELSQAVTQRLAQVFGLEPAQYTPALDRYMLEMSNTLAHRYKWRHAGGASQPSG